MKEDFEELYNMLSADRPKVRNIKDDYEKEISLLMSKVRACKINTADISSDYDMTEDFNKFQLDDINLRCDMEKDAISFKIEILQGLLQDLFVEKKFSQYKREQEQKLNKDEYLVYLNNAEYQNQLISAWYQDFME